jgi:creatinine amidohydrolase
MSMRPRRMSCCIQLLLFSFAVIGSARFAQAQAVTPSSQLSVHWEELTAADFREGIHRAQGTCLLPFGILEKHGRCRKGIRRRLS